MKGGPWRNKLLQVQALSTYKGEMGGNGKQARKSFQAQHDMSLP